MLAASLPEDCEIDPVFLYGVCVERQDENRRFMAKYMDVAAVPDVHIVAPRCAASVLSVLCKT